MSRGPALATPPAMAQTGDLEAGPGYVPVTPLLPDDPPRVGEFWLDARLGATPAGIAFTAHDRADTPAIVILLSEGAAADPAARSRFAGEINALHIDTVLARGGHGQDAGRLARKYRGGEDDPVAPDDRFVAPWAALAYDGSPAAAAQAMQILDVVQIATLPQQGVPSGPDYRQYWINRVRPGLARLWPLPWPGRFDRAGWRTILVSWLLMLLLAALAVLIAILIFRNQPPQSPPPPTGSSASRSQDHPSQGHIGIAAVASPIRIAVFRFAGTIRHAIGRRRADRIRDWVASPKPKSTLEALAPRVLTIFTHQANSAWHRWRGGSVHGAPSLVTKPMTTAVHQNDL